MKKYEIKKHLCLYAVSLLMFIFLWLIFSYYTVISLKTATDLKLNDINILQTIYLNNYQGLRMLVIVCYLPFLFSLNWLFIDDNSLFFIRLPSRNALITKNTVNALMFSFLFAFIHEAVCTLGSIIVFGYQTVLESQVIKFSALNILSLFLYFFKMSLILLLFRNFLSAKIAHYFVFGIYFFEFAFLYSNYRDVIWLPCEDAIVIGDLLSKSISSFDAVFILLRGLVFCAIIFMLTLLSVAKKDVLANEKN